MDIGEEGSIEEDMKYMGKLPVFCSIFIILSGCILWLISEILFGATNSTPMDRPEWILSFYLIQYLIIGLDVLYVSFEHYGRKNLFPTDAVGVHIMPFMLMGPIGGMLVYFIDDIVTLFIVIPIELILAFLVLRNIIRWYKQHV